MTSVLERIQEEVTNSTTYQDSIKREIGWDSMTEEQRKEAHTLAHEQIIHKASVVINGLDKMKARNAAMRNTATQYRRKIEKMHGEIASLENTARNIDNKIEEDTHRLNQIIRAALILQLK